MKVKRSHISLLIKLFGTGFILFLLFRNIQFDADEFISIILNIRIHWFLLSLTGVIIVLLIKSIRWKDLLRQQQINYSIRLAILAYFSSYAVGVISPGRLGELVKVYNVRQDTGTGLIPAFRTTVGDRLFDLAFLYLFGIAGGLQYLGFISWGNPASLIASALFLIMLLFVFRVLFRWLGSSGRLKNNLLISFINDCLIMLTGKHSWRGWLLTALAYVFFFLTTWFLFLSLEINMGIVETAYIISIVGLVLLLPVSVAGFGTREASLVLLLSLYSVDSEAAISFSILQFLSFFIWGGLVGLMCWIANPVPLALLKNDAQKVFKFFRKREKDHPVAY